MTRSPQFHKRVSRSLCRETYQRKAEAWAMLCSQLDDYAIAGNVAGITRALNRLHHSVKAMRDRHQLDPDEAFRAPFDAQAWERRVVGEIFADCTCDGETECRSCREMRA